MQTQYCEQIQKAIVPEKSASRVPAHYNNNPAERVAQYNMLLPDGYTCNSCYHVGRCTALFGQKADAKHCQFYPSRFLPEGIKNEASQKQ